MTRPSLAFIPSLVQKLPSEEDARIAFCSFFLCLIGVHIFCQPGQNNSTLPTTDLLSLGVTAPPAPVPKPNYGGDLLSLGVNEPQPVLASPPNQSSGANELLDAITTINIGGDQSVSGNISSLTTNMGTPNRQQASPSFPNQDFSHNADIKFPGYKVNSIGNHECI